LNFNKDIKTTMVCTGRFHIFDLARELLKRDMLKAIFTGYPGWKLNNEGIPTDRIRTFPWFQAPYMALGKLGFLGESRLQRELAWYAHETLDHHVAKNFDETDVLFALSGSGLSCGRLAQQRGAKYICDRGSSHIRYQDSLLREEFARWGESFPGIDRRFIAKEETEYATANLVTVPSTFSYRSFVKMGVPESKVRKVPYGVNIRRFEKVVDPKPDHFDVLFVGQVGFRKGVPDLLEGFARLRHPKKRLRLVGGMCHEMVRYLRKLPAPEHVEFLGHVPQPKLKNIMSRSHVMVLPSIEEGLALVQAQALACGCPVIGTPNTGADDLFTNGKEGFIVPIRDPQTIANRLQLLADSPDRRSAMSKAALQRVAQLGGWSDYGERMAGVLQELVYEKRSDE
jgi:starch synthase